MDKFTPGPWGEISDEFGRCKRAIAYPDRDERDHDLCVIQCGDPDELEANARLIAAAPDLLIAARAAMRLLDSVAFVSKEGDTAKPLALLRRAVGRIEGAP